MTHNPARWLPDPLGKYQYRYWDGKKWTHDVANNGVQDIHDPNENDATMSTEIIDVSEIEPVPIPTRITIDADTNTQAKWLKLLPSWHSFERYPAQSQLGKYINDLYSRICDVAFSFQINKKIWSSSSLTLERNETAIWTLYRIAENEVIGRYQQSTMDRYRSDFYDGLDSLYKKSEIEELKMICADFCKSMSEPDELTREKLHLTSNGYEYVWYDPDGLIRENKLLSDAEMKTLIFFYNSLTKYMEILEIRVVLLKLYFQVLNVIRMNLNKDIWNASYQGSFRVITAMYKRVEDTGKWYEDAEWEEFKIFAYVFKLCEQSIRENIPYPRYLNISEKVKELQKDLPSSLLSDIEITIDEEVQKLDLSPETIQELRKLSPGGWKKHMEELNNAIPQRCLRILEWYQQDPDCEKIYASAVKYSAENQINNILCLYYYFCSTTKSKTSKPISEALLRSIPDVQQRAVFRDHISDRNISKDDLIAELSTLRESYIHKVELDENKLKESVDVHDATFVKVEEYLRENAIETGTPDDENSSNEKITLAALLGQEHMEDDESEIITNSNSELPNTIFSDSDINLLRMFDTNSNSLSVSAANSLAAKYNKLLESWLRELNQKFYDVYSDQLIMRADGTLYIDEEYIDIVREISHGYSEN